MALLLSILLSLSLHAEDSKLYHCFSRVVVRGNLDDVDSAMKRVSGVFLVFNRVHRPMDNGMVGIDAVIGVAGVDEQDLRSMLKEEWVNRIFTMTGVQASDLKTEFLGCSEMNLKR